MAEPGATASAPDSPPTPGRPQHALPSEGQPLAWLALGSAVLVAAAALAGIVVLVWPLADQRDTAADRLPPASRTNPAFVPGRTVTTTATPTSGRVPWVGLKGPCPTLDSSFDGLDNRTGEGELEGRTSDPSVTSVTCTWAAGGDADRLVRVSVSVYAEAARAGARFDDERTRTPPAPGPVSVVDEPSEWDRAFVTTVAPGGPMVMTTLSANVVVTVEADPGDLDDVAVDVRNELLLRYRAGIHSVTNEVMDDLA